MPLLRGAILSDHRAMEDGRNETRMKGVSFLGVLGALERKHGASVAGAVRASIEGPFGEALRHNEILAGGWYRVGWYDQLLAAIERAMPGEKTVLRDLSHAAVTQDFQTLFRVVRLIGQPGWFLTTATKVMSRYIEGGKVEVLDRHEGEIRLRFDGFAGYGRRTWEDLRGGMEAIADLLQMKNVRTRFVAGGGDGNDFCEFLVRYDP